MKRILPLLLFITAPLINRANTTPDEIDNHHMPCLTAPTLFCPPTYFGCPDDSLDPLLTGTPVAIPGDVNCPQPIVSFTDTLIIDEPCLKKYHRIWMASYDPDSASTKLYSQCVQTLYLEDNSTPELLNIPTDITVSGSGTNCSAIAYWTEPIAIDDCGIFAFDSNISSGSSFPEGVSTISYVAVDNCGNTASANFTVSVICDPGCLSNPAISCPPDLILCPSDTIPGPAITGYAVASPGDSLCLDPVVTYSDSIISTGPCQGSWHILRTWTASDPQNPALMSSCNQNLRLEDNQDPVILYCPQDIFVNATGSGSYCSTPVSWNSPLAIDNCGAPDLESNDINGNPVNNGQLFDAGTTTVIYTATDECGNTSICEFDVTVNCINACTTAPTISCPSNVVVCPGTPTSPGLLGFASASPGANCPAPELSYSDAIIPMGSCYGEKTIQRSWTASYSQYPWLSSHCIQTIEVKDDQSPHFISCPADITVYDTATPVYWNTPIATDNCGIAAISSNYSPGSYFPLGTTSVYYTAEDNCWNSAQCSFNVTVLNPYTITLDCPSDLYLDCDSNGGAYAYWTEPSYTGTCGNCNQYNNYIPGFIYMGSLNGSEYYCSTSVASWPQAKLICESKGGYLASIGSAEENNYLANILTLQSAWIGLSDRYSEGNFEWTSGEALNYTNWLQGQPNNYNNNQDYVEMLHDGRWNDQYNHYALEFIMEIPCSNVHQTGGPVPGTYLSAGTYTVSYEVQDACGGYGSCSFNIYVSGGLEVSCPADITVQAPANGPGIPVNWSEPSATSCCSQCSNGSPQYIPGFFYMGSLNGHDYYCSTSVANWPTAKLNCELNGGYLAVINSEEENTFLADLLNLHSAWIGLSDSQQEGVFEWVDGELLSYTNWYPGQPNNYNNIQDYVELLNDGQWNDQYNHYTLEYIMEIPSCININQVAGPVNGSVLSPGTNHTVIYEITDACGNSELCSFNIEVESVPNNKTYCSSNGTYSQDHHIVNVVFGILNNKSGDDMGYGDYTHICGNIEQGKSYEMHLRPSLTQQDRLYWRVWIDYNFDGDFDDVNEMVAYGSGFDMISGIITIPPLLVSGRTRMRVIMQPGAYPDDPCGTYIAGETEDYCLNTWGTSNLVEDIIETRQKNPAQLQNTDNKGLADVYLYPNPASDFFTLELEDGHSFVELRITDFKGRLIHLMEANEIQESNIFNLEGWPSGLYLIALKSDQGAMMTRKIIIAK